MPDIVMTHAESVVTCAMDVTNQIKALIDCMDNADLLPDGFSDYDDSSGVDEPVSQQVSVSDETKDVLGSAKHLSQSLSLKNGLFERSVPQSIYCGKSKPSDQKHDHHQQHYRHTKSANHIHSIANETESKNIKEKSNASNETTQHHSYYRHKHQKSHHNHHNGRYHAQHHSRHSNKGHVAEVKHSNNNASQNSDSEIVHDEKETVDNAAEVYDIEALAPIRAGQSDEEVNIPIMTPPPPENLNDSPRCSSSYYRPMSLQILFAGEAIQCTFDSENVFASTKTLLSSAVRNISTGCFCSSSPSYQDSLSGWETSKKPGRVKTAKRRRNARQSDNTFSRLTQHTGKDPVVFHHYKDTMKYIERYRFYHTVGNVGRPLTYTNYDEKVPGADPYYIKMKSDLTSVMNTQMYNIASQMIEEKAGSASSEGSVHERPRSDDESNEGSGVDAKTCSMRDRGKALNLAPVRECTVPNLTPTDKLNMIQLNQYLNLSTPPTSSGCLDFDIDDVKAKRYGYRLANDNYIFATSGARRRTRTLRLGSAEFVKPGTAESATGKWSSEQRPTQKSATNILSTVPGNLIVGSTISPIPIQPIRARSGGKMPPYIQFQKDNMITDPQSPLQHVSGQKVKTCERLIDTPVSGKERGKFGYTHAVSCEKLSPPIRTATAVDFRETYIPRNRSRTITLDMNHLGIRGQPLKQSEQMALYKNRRAQFVRS